MHEMVRKRTTVVTDEELVTAYLDHFEKTNEEVADMLGISRFWFIRRLSMLRAEGVKIPRKLRGRKPKKETDIQGLNALVDGYEVEGGEEA